MISKCFAFVRVKMPALHKCVIITLLATCREEPTTKYKLVFQAVSIMKKSFLPAILLIFCAFFVRGAAQASPQPYQEKLLNGLKVLVWNDPASDRVTLKLRVHSGSAFDPKDKMGVMALLADIIFPDEQTFNYFKEDLNGELKVNSNYDFIEITA